MILTVHDELMIEVDDRDVETVSALVKEVMESVVKVCVPLEVEVGSGQNWAEAKK
jgi:DNA polymerase-1